MVAKESTKAAQTREVKEAVRRMRQTDWKFNDEKDFIDYSISYYCEESTERIQKAFAKLTDEIGQILEDDRVLRKKREAIPEEE